MVDPETMIPRSGRLALMLAREGHTLSEEGPGTQSNILISPVILYESIGRQYTTGCSAGLILESFSGSPISV